MRYEFTDNAVVEFASDEGLKRFEFESGVRDVTEEEQAVVERHLVPSGVAKKSDSLPQIESKSDAKEE